MEAEVMAQNDPTEHDLYVVVVTCVPLRENKNGEMESLILKRSEEEEEGPGLWTIPGGKVERKKGDWGDSRSSSDFIAGENVLERAMAREMFEETDITVDEFFIMKNSDLVFVRRTGELTLVICFWTVCSYDVQVTLGGGGESTEYTWVSRDKLSRYEFIGNIGTDIIAAIEEYKTARQR